MTSAEQIAEALGGHPAGDGWMARCPVHDDRNASLSIRDGGGKVLVYCHAGCDQQQVIAALQSRGLWTENHQPRSNNREDAERTEYALGVWQSTEPAGGTLVERYLASRGLHLPIPPTLRFHPGLKHRSAGIWPAMVALVRRGVDRQPLGILRTFLARDGGGKAPVNPQRMMLGPCRGGAVRLANRGGVLMVGEGIETCLAVMQSTGHATWAALSTSGLRTLDLPNDVRDVIVLADGDDPGEAAARACAWRWKREGRRVRIARPPRGTDFNDMLVGRASGSEEDVR